MTYGQSCTTFLCNPNFSLTCSSGGGTGCSCPTGYGGSTCDCTSTQYWTGSACTARSTFGQTCPTGQNYNCLSGLNLICSGGSCVCLNSNYYWTGSSCREYLIHICYIKLFKVQY